MPLFGRKKAQTSSKKKGAQAPASSPPPDDVADIYNPKNTIKYVVRSPWSWVMEEVTADAKNIVEVSTVADLPSKNPATDDIPPPSNSSSRRRKKKVKGPCNLRVVVEDANGEILEAVHGISEAFDGLEDKDELVRTVQRCRCEHLELTPPSRLLNWDVTKEECLNLVGDSMPTLLANNGDTQQRIGVLKEPMGSQGTGIFFVKTADEIHGIIEEHRKRAVEEPDFLDNLIAMKGRIPSWVLQAEVRPCLLVRDRRKFHIRTYVVALEDLEADDILETYIYNRHEVRIAGQPVPENENDSRDPTVHITNGAGSSTTESVLMNDVPGLVVRDMQTKVEKFVAQIFGTHFAPDMTKRVGYCASQDDDAAQDIRKFAVAGLDILVTEDYRLYLLEVNVNPQAPPKAKLPTAFQNHLEGFMKDLLDVVLGKQAPNFVSVSSMLE